LRDEGDQLVSADSLGDPTAALAHVIENPEDAIYLFYDVHRHLTPVTTRLVRDAARAVRMTRKSVLFLSPSLQVPEELQKEISLAVFHPPDRDELEPLVNRLAEELAEEGFPVELSRDDRLALARAATGLTLNEAGRALRKAVAQSGGLRSGCEKLVIEEKTQVIRKTGILEYYPASESFNNVGGLEGLKAWFKSRTPVFTGAAHYAGLPQPKGVLLVGVPGCGKSLSARALAGVWGVPLLRLDVGRIFGPHVGEAEANLRLAIQTAEAVSPCILWIDEVEKGFAGTRSDSGGGVAARVFGTFLSWLQDKKSPVFVVATANDISSLPPEFLRQGRFDEIFFVDLPGEKQREEIFRIHLARRGRAAENFDLRALIESSEGFSGAELEQAVIEGLFRAFEADREIETGDITQAVKDTFPLSSSRAAEIAALRQWAGKNARAASRSV
jgi:SpoVK/Ycf46/Vps4 family AAA+-type ATPase